MTTVATHPYFSKSGPLDEYVRQSVCDTLRAICGGETTPLSAGREEVPFDGVCGIISIAGDLVCSFVLGLPRQTAFNLVLAFAGCEIDFDSPDMGDAVGELANILAGDFVARLDEAGVTAAISIPMVARGHDVELLLPSEFAASRIAFEAPVGRLWTKLATVQPGERRTGRQ